MWASAYWAKTYWAGEYWASPAEVADERQPTVEVILGSREYQEALTKPWRWLRDRSEPDDKAVKPPKRVAKTIKAVARKVVQAVESGRPVDIRPDVLRALSGWSPAVGNGPVVDHEPAFRAFMDLLLEQIENRSAIRAQIEKEIAEEDEEFLLQVAVMLIKEAI